MNRKIGLIFVVVIAISSISFFFTGIPWIPVAFSVLFFPVARKISTLLGLLNGVLATSVPFVFYNGTALGIISKFIQSVTGLNPILSIALFPLMTGITSMLVALLGSEIYHVTAKS